jgi:uncharacterized protein YbjT (DUF2867 family)
MVARSEGFHGRRVTPVSADDVTRVLARALAEGTRIRLTAGQRLAILNRRPGAARA